MYELDKICNVIEKSLGHIDPTTVEIIAATVLANRMTGPPVWLVVNVTVPPVDDVALTGPTTPRPPSPPLPELELAPAPPVALTVPVMAFALTATREAVPAPPSAPSLVPVPEPPLPPLAVAVAVRRPFNPFVAPARVEVASAP